MSVRVRLVHEEHGADVLAPGADDTSGSWTSAQGKPAWHLAADLVEQYAPLLFEHTLAAARLAPLFTWSDQWAGATGSEPNEPPPDEPLAALAGLPAHEADAARASIPDGIRRRTSAAADHD
ncbi:hypothetical protein [Rhodococcus indonesiensis]|uniref:hypothetical protein n=1 Tax=Rhodococcus indonesiensis TaxID=3055869 RepID=UPI0039F6781A